MLNFKKILVPVDFSEHAQRALHMACDIAAQSDAELELLHVYQVPGVVFPEGFIPASPEMYNALVAQIDRGLETQRRFAEARGCKRVGTKTLEGVPHEAIVKEAEAGAFDLIVIATHGRTGLKHVLLGSVAENIVRRAACPVLTLRQS